MPASYTIWTRKSSQRQNKNVRSAITRGRKTYFNSLARGAVCGITTTLRPSIHYINRWRPGAAVVTAPANHASRIGLFNAYGLASFTQAASVEACATVTADFLNWDSA